MRLFVFILCLMLSAVLKAEQLSGVVSFYSAETVTMKIDGRSLTINPNASIATADGRVLSLASVARGMDVQVKTDSNGRVDQIIIVGPTDRVNELFRH